MQDLRENQKIGPLVPSLKGGGEMREMRVGLILDLKQWRRLLLLLLGG